MEAKCCLAHLTESGNCTLQADHGLGGHYIEKCDELLTLTPANAMHSEADIRSIDNCITVLQEGLHQPGTPAIVLKLAASWQKLKDSLCPPSTVVQLPQGEEELVTLSDNEGTVAAVFEVPKMNEHTETQVAADSNLETKSQEVVLESLGVQSSESKGQEISSEPLEVQSSGLLLFLTRG